MGWTETHRYYTALREIEQVLDRGEDVPWRPEWADVFGSPTGLGAALTRRWRVLAEAQLADVFEPLGTTVDELTQAHPGLARVVAAARPLAVAAA
jgi:hypothetical protein